EWCSNCHPQYGVDNDGNKHPAGNAEGLDGYATNYNHYIATGNWDPDPDAAHYDDLVPFETGDTKGDLTLDDPTATASSNVMCVTCHRAHASPWDNITRWNTSNTLMVEEFEAGTLDAALKAVAFYKNGVAVDMLTEYGEFQRSLCNKCHVQD
ncbi:MAG: hypothetical protein OEM01_07355, partial [Desulfobulbaceae bacterium]|nr:hypothetical protein [Desulfobulbaceae bacterium]